MPEDGPHFHPAEGAEPRRARRPLDRPFASGLGAAREVNRAGAERPPSLPTSGISNITLLCPTPTTPVRHRRIDLVSTSGIQSWKVDKRTDGRLQLAVHRPVSAHMLR